MNKDKEQNDKEWDEIGQKSNPIKESFGKMKNDLNEKLKEQVKNLMTEYEQVIKADDILMPSQKDCATDFDKFCDILHRCSGNLNSVKYYLELKKFYIEQEQLLLSDNAEALQLIKEQMEQLIWTDGEAEELKDLADYSGNNIGTAYFYKIAMQMLNGKKTEELIKERLKFKELI